MRLRWTTVAEQRGAVLLAVLGCDAERGAHVAQVGWLVADVQRNRVTAVGRVAWRRIVIFIFDKQILYS